MRILTTLISLVLFGLFIYYGHYQKAGPLPPVVEFFNPYHGWWQQAERQHLPERFFRGSVSGEVKVAFDDRWVPHIYADTYEDAIYAQGILHAHFRLWQMDMTSRASVGQLSEVLGERTLDYDRSRRQLGMMEAAHIAEENFDGLQQTRSVVDQYVRGVNEYIEQMDRADHPLEFKLLDYQPESWSSLKTAMVVTAMTYDLCFKHEDVQNTTTLAALGNEAFEDYFPKWNKKQSPIIQKDSFEYLQEQINMNGLSIKERDHDHLMPDPDNGSNNWAIHKSRTATNNNILANDPHLRLRLPSVWYEMHIHLPDRSIYGVSFPGIPGVVLGFNSFYAWGSTNVGHDIADWYYPVWKDSSLSAYQFDGQWNEAELIQEIIEVKGSAPDTVKSLSTRLGRVPHTDAQDDLYGAIFRWGPILPLSGSSMHTFLGFNLGSNYDDFKSALNHHKFPAQNFVFADRSDNIALHIQGALPIRDHGDGRFILDSMTQPTWQKYIPQELLPYEHNPDRGFVSSANQHSTYPSYPFEYHGSFEDFRGRTLDQMLQDLPDASPEDVMEMQQSSFSLKAKEALPQLLSYLDSLHLDSERNELSLLNSWNYECNPNEKAAVLFELWWSEFKKQSMDEWGEDNLKIEDFVFIELLEEHPEDSLFDIQSTKDKFEDATDIVNRSWLNALTSFDSLGMPDWQTHKGTYIEHMARIDAFSTEVLSVPGSPDALNATKEHHGPSWRMIVELGEEIKAWGIYPGGQSGNPGSHFYDNQVQDWVQGTYYSLSLPELADSDSFGTIWTIKSKP